jgi:hypothetical protein
MATLKEISGKSWVHYLGITIISSVFFIPFNGRVHLFDWDEINFAESAREMIVSGDYLNVQINFQTFWEKPPLFIWMQVLSMKMFGINEFAARFPDAICGIITLLVLYAAGSRLYDKKFGLFWVFAYSGSILPFLYFKSGIIDPWFNFFIFVSLLFLIRGIRGSGKALPAFAAFFLGLAVLTKGPVAILIVFLTLTAYYVANKTKIKINAGKAAVFLTVLAITGGFWFLLQIMAGHFSIIEDFISYQIRLFSTKDAGHGGFLLYHFVVLFFGVFPASAIALPSFFQAGTAEDTQRDFRKWMIILFLVVLILFTIVKTKIVHYSSLCYFPLTYMAAVSIYNFSELKSGWKSFIFHAVSILAVVFSLSVICLTFIDRYKELLTGYIKDPFAAECLKADGKWQGYEFLAGVAMLAGLAVFIVFRRKKSFQKAFISLLLSVSVFVFSGMFLVTPHIERYSQNAAVEFFESVSGEDAYLRTLGYKSYAHLFYGKARKQENPLSADTEWLVTGNIDKTAYFAFKITGRDKYTDLPGLTIIYEKNGFIFARRKPFSQ